MNTPKKISRKISACLWNFCVQIGVGNLFLPIAAAGILSAVLFIPEEAHGRSGGGHSYSGSSGGGGSSSGSVSITLIIDIIRLLIWLCRRHPLIGYPLVVILILILIFWLNKPARQSGFSTSSDLSSRTGNHGAGSYTSSDVSLNDSCRFPSSSLQIQKNFKSLHSIDPNFSRPLFEDFVYFLYGELQRSRGCFTPAVSAYATDAVLKRLRGRDSNIDISGIVIGSMKILKVAGFGTPKITIDISVESNLSENSDNGEQRIYLHQLMRLIRRAGAVSRPIERIHTLDCPNCGASIENMTGRICSYCGSETGTGFNDWLVTNLITLKRSPRGPLLTSTVDETGTDLPTRYSPSLNNDLRSLMAAHPEVSPNAILTRTRDIWTNLQEGWMDRDALRIRPFVTDNLFEHMVYWIDMYRQERCRNVCIGEGSPGFISAEIVSVDSDKVFDSVTLRLFAKTPEYTISDSGEILSGKKGHFRQYSEYWTMIRGHVSDKMNADPSKCPACGAPLNISAGGNCGYCQAKVTSGDFDWVLSRIEQDESYAG